MDSTAIQRQKGKWDVMHRLQNGIQWRGSPASPFSNEEPGIWQINFKKLELMEKCLKASILHNVGSLMISFPSGSTDYTI